MIRLTKLLLSIRTSHRLVTVSALSGNRNQSDRSKHREVFRYLTDTASGSAACFATFGTTKSKMATEVEDAHAEVKRIELSEYTVKKVIPELSWELHKGQMGRVGVIGGSKE